ncbi:lysine decarboxylase-like protein [Penicillium taxi]|uniref:lysine decarboxylase-like protein n=1 Tax=Penicillium taxi TaxID=168475 RepID=UPI002545984B|nr:lysine decarboxylase-like protein [Penicillium taxi]KAJ5902448.1 lysine decarboxylase-like protein [Penicillium taxi]
MAQFKPAVVCVFWIISIMKLTSISGACSCGATSGKDPVHFEAARTLAQEFHKNNVQLVYGGGTTGLMGEIARTLVSLSGPKSVHGIIPRALVKVSTKDSVETTNNHSGKAAERIVSDELGESGIPESEYGITTIVSDMHTRKRLMATKVMEGGPGSGFVSLAGGFGTIEEVMEMTTWNQLGIHHVGVVLLNINGYWDGLLTWIRNAVREGYISMGNGSIVAEARCPTEVWPKLLEYQNSNDRMQLNWGQE